MKYEQKTVHFGQSTKIKKQGISNNIQRYFCHQCHKTFTFKTKLVPNKIWSDYTSGKQTYQQLAVKYHCSVRTIQRYIDKAPKTSFKLIPEHCYGYNFFRSLFWRISVN